MDDFHITGVVETDDGWEYEATIADQTHTVRVRETYYQRLTNGDVSPEELVRESFAFLLEREPAASILTEFELPLIERYFPEYEATISQRIRKT